MEKKKTVKKTRPFFIIPQNFVVQISLIVIKSHNFLK